MGQRKRRADGLLEKKRTIGGKVIHFYGHTVAEIEQKIDDYKAELAEREANGELFEVVYDDWMKLRRTQVKPSTLKCSTSACARTRAEWAGCRMREITPTRIAAWYQRLGDKGYAKGTVRNHNDVLSSVFRHWIVYFGGDFNPVPYVDVPRNLSTKVRTPPTEEQLAAVRAHPEGFGFVAWLLMYTGIRLGEAMALQWRDVDFAAGVLHISKSVWWNNGQPVVTTPKTKNAIRDVPILAVLRPLLLERQGAPTAFVCSGRATPLAASEYRCEWAAYWRSLGFWHRDQWGTLAADVSAHQFRHGMASILYEAGVGEMEAQRILGHASITTTHEVYTHLRQAQLTAATDRLNSFLASGSQPDNKS